MGYFGAVILFLWQNPPSPGDRDHALTRAFGSSAAPELVVPWQERFGVTLYEVYGSTEIGLGSGLGPGFPPKLGTMGLPCRQLEVAIVDENDNTLPRGQVGEAVWRPREPFAIFQGYWNQPQATVDAWRNLWFHSADEGLLDEDGYFVFKDRLKDSIRRRGENISSFEVEMAVRGHAGVIECAAYAGPAPGPVTEEEVMIAVVADPSAPPEPDALFRALCVEMPRHAVPRFLRFVDELPKTPTQRIQKFKLRDDGITTDAVDREALGIFPPKE
jgi:crotonobetaine/carnitine-CoA ligase